MFSREFAFSFILGMLVLNAFRSADKRELKMTLANVIAATVTALLFTRVVE